MCEGAHGAMSFCSRVLFIAIRSSGHGELKATHRLVIIITLPLVLIVIIVLRSINHAVPEIRIGIELTVDFAMTSLPFQIAHFQSLN